MNDGDTYLVTFYQTPYWQTCVLDHSSGLAQGSVVINMSCTDKSWSHPSSLSDAISPSDQNERSERGTQRSNAAKQQHKYVEQASASSGNQFFLGHRFVPRFELFASNNSTNGGRTMRCVLARPASAIIPDLQKEMSYATGS